MINYSRLGYEIKRDFTSFSQKISKGLKRPQEKFVHQMIYSILAGNKLHLSEIARSLKENITLKKTIDRLSRNLNVFANKSSFMHNYLTLVKQHVKDDYAVIIIDNSDIAKPASRKLEALSEIRDGSTGEITQGCLTIDAAVLSEKGKMPLPVYEKVFSAAEKGFISETYENLCCLESLSGNFSPKCVRTLDRGFDANDYYRYFLKRGERFAIRAKKNRNVIYGGQTCNIMDVALRYKGAYRMDFKDKHGKTIRCKMSCIPVRLCEFPEKELVLTAVYGFGEEPMLLLSNLKMQEKKKLCHIITKVYLLRWRIEEYFRFKKQQFELEDLRVMSLQSIRNLNLLAMLAVGYVSLTTTVHKDSIFLAELKECSKRIYEVPQFALYAIGYVKVQITASRKDIYLVLVYGVTEHPMMLATNKEIRSKEDVVRVARIYFSRWKIEEYFRCKKQMFRFENFRVRKLKAVNALNFYITLCMAFLGMVSMESETNALKVSIIKTAAPIKQKVSFCYYRLAKGISGILSYASYGASPSCMLCVILVSSHSFLLFFDLKWAHSSQFCCFSSSFS